MRDKDSLQLLRQNLSDLSESKKWLERSFNLCQTIDIKEQYLPTEFDTFENLTSRFARTTDFVINKVFRSIDKVELEISGATLDVLNRAHRRGIIDNVSEIREIKELRNEIAYAYSNKELVEIFKEVLIYSVKLFAIIDNTRQYCREKYDI